MSAVAKPNKYPSLLEGLIIEALGAHMGMYGTQYVTLADGSFAASTWSINDGSLLLFIPAHVLRTVADLDAHVIRMKELCALYDVAWKRKAVEEDGVAQDLVDGITHSVVIVAFDVPARVEAHFRAVYSEDMWLASVRSNG